MHDDVDECVMREEEREEERSGSASKVRAPHKDVGNKI